MFSSQEICIQARISELFAPEAQQGIRVFSGGKDIVDVAEMSQDERDAVTYCFDQNIKKLENVSPKLASLYRPQREAMIKMAGIAKGTFPEQKIYSYPGQTGGLGVDFINPYLFGHGNVTNGVGASGYTTYDGLLPGTTEIRSWNVLLNTAGTMDYILGYDGTYGYSGCATDQKHSFVAIFQDGITEVGTTPKIAQMHFKTSLMDRYVPISVPPLVGQTIEQGKSIYVYNTPGIIPCPHNYDTWIRFIPLYTGIAHLPLMGMVFYETDFNAGTMTTH